MLLRVCWLGKMGFETMVVVVMDGGRKRIMG
jgi:hypothetical protein